MEKQRARRGTRAWVAGCLLGAGLLGGCSSPPPAPVQAGRPADVQAEMQKRLGTTSGPGQAAQSSGQRGAPMMAPGRPLAPGGMTAPGGMAPPGGMPPGR
jgi:hypothetical protein